MYIRSTHNIRGRILCTHYNSGPYPARIRHAVVARANRCQGTIDPIAPRPCSEVDLLSDQTFCKFSGTTISTMLCNKLRSRLTQCDLACTVWIHWATALSHTTIRSSTCCLLSLRLLASTVWIDWTAGALSRRRCQALLTSAIWIDRTTQLSLHAVSYTIDLCELALRLELNVVHVVEICFV